MTGSRNNGSITVFLAIIFVSVISLLGTLIDGARLVSSHAQVYHAADLAATSALSSFNRDLKDRYGLFAYEGDPADIYTLVAKQNLTVTQNGELSVSEELYEWIYSLVFTDLTKSGDIFDVLALQDVKASKIGDPLTLQNSYEFERQIFEYVKLRGPVQLVVSELSSDFSKMEDELEKAENEMQVDDDMVSLQNRYAKLLGDFAQYNEWLVAVRNRITVNIVDMRPSVNDMLQKTPSEEGLGDLAEKLEEFAPLFDLGADLSGLESKLKSLKSQSDVLIADVKDFKGRFSGSGDDAKYKGNQSISGDMMGKFIKDLEAIEQGAQLSFEGSDYDKQLALVSTKLPQAATSVRTSLEAHAREVRELIRQLNEEESSGSDDGDEDDDEEEEEPEEDNRIDELWNRIKEDVSGSVGTGANIQSVMNDGKELREIKIEQISTNQDEGKADDILKDFSKQVEEEDDNKKREYTRVIPDDYKLPAEIAVDLLEAEKAEAKSSPNWKGMKDYDEAENKRAEDRQGLGWVRQILGGMGEFALDTLDNAMLAAYATGNFSSTLCFNGPDHEVTGPYTRNMRDQPKQGFFQDCDIEYLIKGKKAEQDNYKAVRQELLAIYTALNYANIRRTDTISDTVEAIAKAVENAVRLAIPGAGVAVGKVAYYATREAVYGALAYMQAREDLNQLYEGAKVPLIKPKDKNYTVITKYLGLGGNESDPNEGASLHMGYMDYAFLRMVMQGNDRLVGRLQNLVEINMNAKSGSDTLTKSFDLTKCNTSATVKVEARMPYWFINLLFVAESADGTSIGVEQRVSQKY